jgi:hypothetical protein
MPMDRRQHFEHKFIILKNLRKCFGKCARKLLYREIDYDHFFLVDPTLVCDVASERSDQGKTDQKTEKEIKCSFIYS